MVADRAYLKGARIGAGLGRLEAEVARILAVLGSTGAIRVEPAALQPADVALDLYGEDIRARAFVTSDDGAELMLRPDFTLPIVRLHMEAGAEPARYAYCGPVWRRQEFGSDRPREYLQAGFEIFEAGDPAATDAEVLGLVVEALGDAPVDLVTGDLGLAFAVIDALDTSAARRMALRRHVWRPARFRALLDRYGEGHAAAAAGRAALAAAEAEGRVPELVAGRRRRRRPAHARGRRRPDHRAGGRGAHAAARRRRGGADRGGARRRRHRRRRAGRAARPRARPRAARRGGRPARRRGWRRWPRAAIEPGTLRFEASFGRTTLEYYDGFVFGALPRGRPDLPPIASGGRYDALTRALGHGRGIPAVGGMLRPEALVALTGGAAC